MNETNIIITELYFIQVLPCLFEVGKIRPDPDGGKYGDPLTEAKIGQFVYVLDVCDPIDATGAAAPRKEPANACGKRGDPSSCILKALSDVE
jgi:hypothetical protein